MKTHFTLLSCLLLAAAGFAASDAAPATVAKTTHVITDYGAVPNAPNDAEQTRAIQTALKACRDAGGVLDMRFGPMIERPLPAFLLVGADGVRIRDCRGGFDGEPRPEMELLKVINCRNVDGEVKPIEGAHQ